MVKIWENNGTEEIGLVTPAPDHVFAWHQTVTIPLHELIIS